jgi:hypothetical protein
MNVIVMVLLVLNIVGIDIFPWAMIAETLVNGRMGGYMG